MSDRLIIDWRGLKSGLAFFSCPYVEDDEGGRVSSSLQAG
jgi:hypothetical protein